MPFSLFPNIQNLLERVRSHFYSRVNYTLSENDISRLADKTKSKANGITQEAELSSQLEMINQTLEKRENELEKKLEPQRDIQKGKDQTREGLYRTLRANKNSDKTFSK